jgi:hypothetical protein
MTEVLERKHNDAAYWSGVKTAEGMIQFYKFYGNLTADIVNKMLDEVCSCKASCSAESDYLAGMMYELEDELKEIKRGGR